MAETETPEKTGKLGEKRRLSDSGGRCDGYGEEGRPFVQGDFGKAAMAW